MTTEEIRNAAIKAAKDYGYDWAMADWCVDDDDDYFKKQMKENGYCQVCIFDGEEPCNALEGVDVEEDIDMIDVMEEGEIFNEGDMYHWITLGRIEAWKEILRRKSKKNSVGYFCDGYGGYVFFPETQCVEHLKQRGTVVMA